MSTAFLVGGMSCEGCAKAVSGAIQRAVPGAGVTVDLAGGRVELDRAAPAETLRRAVEQAGFEWRGAA